jgi:hypothetical protein
VDLSNATSPEVGVVKKNLLCLDLDPWAQTRTAGGGYRDLWPRDRTTPLDIFAGTKFTLTIDDWDAAMADWDEDIWTM